MMFKFLCMAALVSSAAAAGLCGPGTVLVNGQCQVAAPVLCGSGTVLVNGQCQVAAPVARARREGSAAPEIQTADSNLKFKVSDGQKVGVQVGEKGPVQYVDTTETAANAVVAALKLGYAMNREIDQVKDMNALNIRLTDMINSVSKENQKVSGDVKTLSSNVDTKIQLAKKATDDTLAAAKKKTDADIVAALAAVAKSAKESKETLEKFEKSTKSTVEGLAKAVPAASCANGVKDGDETDVDCGGACGKNCAKGKKCKTSMDCGTTICGGGTCRTCKGFTGSVAISEGVTAYCESNQLRAAKGKPYIQFNTCGQSRERGPDANDCHHTYSFAPEQYSIHRTYVEHKWGFQIFTAPIDGNYKWWLYGAQGGSDATCGRHYRSSYNRYGKGGWAGRVIATQNNVKAGTKFYIRVGQRGYDCWATKSGMRNPAGEQPKQNCQYNPSGYGGWDNGKAWTDPEAFHQGFGACGGFNGGGPAICNADPGGASGGGGTDIRMCKMGEGCVSPPDLKKRFLVAGGGGGGAAEGNNAHGNGGSCRWGGHGGGTSGENGYNSGNVGYGGTQSRGGRHQSENNRDHGSSWGTLGMGGTGGQNDAGGGGGGYFGGGGARYNAGGGGGSSYVGGTSASGKPVSVTNNRGNHRGEGKINLIIYSA